MSINLESTAYLGGFSCHYLLNSRGVVNFVESSMPELIFPSCKLWVKSVLFDYLQFYECYSMAFSKDESPTNSELQPFVISHRGNNWNSSVNYDYILCGTCWHGEDNPSKISRWEEDQNVNRLSGIRVQFPSQKQYYWPWVCLVSWLLRVISIWQH